MNDNSYYYDYEGFNMAPNLDEINNEFFNFLSIASDLEKDGAWLPKHKQLLNSALTIYSLINVIYRKCKVGLLLLEEEKGRDYVTSLLLQAASKESMLRALKSSDFDISDDGMARLKDSLANIRI